MPTVAGMVIISLTLTRILALILTLIEVEEYRRKAEVDYREKMVELAKRKQPCPDRSPNSKRPNPEIIVEAVIKSRNTRA